MRRTAKIFGVVLALLVLIAVALPFLVNANDFRPRIESALTTALGRKVTLGNLKLKLFPVKILADNLSIGDDPSFSSAPFLQAKGLSLGVEIWPLISSRKLNVTGLTIENPDIVLLQSPSGKWNFSDLGAKPAAPVNSAPSETPGTSAASGTSGLALSAKLVKITGGRLSVGSAASGSKPRIFENIQVEVQNFSPTSVFPFSLSAKAASGGDISLHGQAGPINSGDTASTPVQASLKVTALQLADGLLSMDGSGSSNGSSLQGKGQVKADGIKLARGGTPAREPVGFDFAVNYDLLKHAGVLSQGDIHIGKAVASLTGTYAESGQPAVLNMHLLGSNMPVSELAGMLPPLDIVLPAGSSLQGGDIAVDMNINGPVNGLVTSGSLGMRNTRVAGFDLGGKLSAIGQLAGIKSGLNTEIQVLTADLRAAPEGTTVQNLKLVVPAVGELDGAGTISPSHVLDFKMLAAVHAGTLLAKLGQRESAKVPFFVQGTSSNPVFKPDLKGLAASEINRLQKKNLGKTVNRVLQGLFGGKK